MIYSFAKQLFGIVTVEQEGDVVTVEGVSAGKLALDIQKQWKTSRIFGSIVYDAGMSRFKISAFFIPEIIYILEQLLEPGRRFLLSSGRRAIVDLLNGLEKNTWWKEVKNNVDNPPPPRLDFRKLDLFIHKPMDYNLRYFEDYEFQTGVLGKRGSICAGAPGSGKTYMALAIAEMVHSDYVFICAPKNTMEDPWRQAMNAEDLYKRPQEYWMAKDGEPYKGQRFVVFHYDAMEKALEVAKKLPRNKKVTVILDESHHMNEMTSQRTELFINLCEMTKSEDIVWASGTPVKKMGYEVIPFLITTDPMFGKREREQFKRAFGREGKRGADILQDRMSRVMTVVEKSEFKKEKPNVETISVQLKDGDKYTLDNIRKQMREFYEERVKYYEGIRDIYERDYLAGVETYVSLVGKGVPTTEFQKYRDTVSLLRRARDYRTLGKEMQYCNTFEKKQILPALPKDVAKRFIEAKSAYKYLPLKIQGECLGRVVGGAREACSSSIAMEADIDTLIKSSNSKTVIFTAYVKAVENAVTRLKSEGYKDALMLYGKNSKDIAGVLRAFKANPHANPLVTTFKSLSTGVPLLDASTEIMLDSPFRPYIFEQTVSRVDRLGQEHSVNIFVLQLETGSQPNISTRSRDILDWAKEQVEAITGIKSPYEVEDRQNKGTASLEDYTGWEERVSMEDLDARGEYTYLNDAKDISRFPSLGL